MNKEDIKNKSLSKSDKIKLDLDKDLFYILKVISELPDELPDAEIVWEQVSNLYFDLLWRIDYLEFRMDMYIDNYRIYDKKRFRTEDVDRDEFFNQLRKEFAK